MKKDIYEKIFYKRLNILFKWKSDSIIFPKNFEKLLRENGTIAFHLEKKIWLLGDYKGLRNRDGNLDEYIGTTLQTENKETIEGIDGKDLIVCRNNDLGYPDREFISYMAEMNEETDKSIRYQLINSRNIPVITATNETQKREIESAFEDIKAGKPVVVKSKLMDEVNVLDITDKTAIEKMQYIDTFQSVLEKQFSNYFGIAINMIDKRAQVNSYELTSHDDLTSLDFLCAYESRLAFCEEMKKAGFNVECIKNPIFFDEPEKKEIETGKPDKEKDEAETGPEKPERENMEGRW